VVRYGFDPSDGPANGDPSMALFCFMNTVEGLGSNTGRCLVGLSFSPFLER
jgi:hypothetical protein